MCEKCHVATDFNLASASFKVALAKLTDNLEKKIVVSKSDLADVVRMASTLIAGALHVGAVLGHEGVVEAMYRAKQMPEFAGMLKVDHDLISRV